MLAIRVIITTISYDALRILSPAIPLLPPVGDFVLLPLIGFGGFIPRFSKYLFSHWPPTSDLRFPISAFGWPTFGISIFHRLIRLNPAIQISGHGESCISGHFFETNPSHPLRKTSNYSGFRNFPASLRLKTNPFYAVSLSTFWLVPALRLCG